MLLRTPPVNLAQASKRLWLQYADGMRMGAEQKRRFECLGARSRLHHLLFTGACSVVLFNLFLFSDRYMIPDVYELAVRVRLYILTPAILSVVFAGLVLRHWWLAHTPPWLTEAIAAVGTMSVSASLGAVMLASHSALVSVYPAGLVPVLVFGNLVQRLRFRYALASTLFNLAVCLVAMWTTLDKLLPYRVMEVPVIALLVLVAIYTLISNFNLEVDERQHFLQVERAQQLRQRLEQTQVELHQLSRLDPLTGLANRRQLEDYVSGLVQAKPSAPGLSVMLIDIDHFKAFNDRYGHSAGDQCLRVVASALHLLMQGKHGLLARWGGEEFVIVLPSADAAAALALGESLRQRIEALAMRHEASSTAPHITISCGICVRPQVDNGPHAQALLKEADKALYAAKDAGRNRCVLA